MIVGIDIDNTILDTDTFIISKGRADFPDREPVKGERYVNKIFSMSEDEEKAFWGRHAIDYVMNTPYMPGAKFIIDQLMNTYHIPVYIITKRGCYDGGLNFCRYTDEEMRDLTIKSLEKHKINYDKIVFTSDKAGFIKENGVTVMIDDDPENLDAIKSTTECKAINFISKLGYNLNANCHAIAHSWGSDMIHLIDPPNIFIPGVIRKNNIL